MTMADSPLLSTAFHSAIRTAALPTLSPDGEFSVVEQTYVDSRTLRALLTSSMNNTIYQLSMSPVACDSGHTQRERETANSQ
jgi:hypothetical protein